MRISGRKPRFWISAIRVFQVALFCFAIASLAYAVITAPRNGIDFRSYYNGALEWVEGRYLNESGSLFTYPPFAIPVLSPLALFPFELSRILWLTINLLAFGIGIYSIIKCWGEDWPVEMKFYLAACVLASSPFRVTLRVGQISLIITALICGALLARKRNMPILAGALLGLSLCKFTLSFPFFLYFIWKKEWKIVLAGIILMLALTQIYALRLGLSVFQIVSNYAVIFAKLPSSDEQSFIGSTEIKPLLSLIASGDKALINPMLIFILVTALVSMTIVFRRRPKTEKAHFAALSLFALLAVYHRTYDAVMCLLPAALFIDFIVRKRLLHFSMICLAGLFVIALSIPGVLTSRLGIGEESLSSSTFGLIGLHIERVIVFGMFWSLLVLLWKVDPCRTGNSRESKTVELAQRAK